MSVKYFDEKKLFKIDAGRTSYVLQVRENGYLQHLYYGAYVSDYDLEYLLSYHCNISFAPRSVSAQSSYFSLDSQQQEYSCNGAGDFRISAFSVEPESGSSATEIKYVGYRIINGKPPLSGLPSTYVENEKDAQTLEIDMLDSLTGAKVTLCYTAFSDYNAITRSVRVENTSDSPFFIERVFSGCVDFNHKDFDLIHLYGKWASERFVERKPLFRGIQSVASKRGSSSHNHNPFVALVSHDATEYSGEAYGFNLVYSGNFTADIEVDTFDTTRIIMGINPIDFKWKLEPNETFTSPELVMVYSNEGIGEMSRTFHSLYRNHLARGKYKNKRRPVLINIWEAAYFNFTGDLILNIAKTASELGMEMLVMDDGWFGDRSDESTSIGDWVVNEKKLGGSLTNLVDKVNSLGLKFGIWFEPEIVGYNSDLYRAHPDWCLHVEGRDRSIGRHTLVLDMSRKEVRDHVFNMMSNVLKSANIEYVKWDFNRNLTEVGSAALPPDRQKEVFHRYILGVYELMDRINKAFPDILFEGCSGGGGRFDPAILYYFSQIWTSDDTDALERCRIQYGTSFAYPTSVMSAHVSAAPNHQTHRDMSFKTRGDVATSGVFGYELDISKITDEEKELIKEQIKNYNELHDLIIYGDLYRLVSPFDNDYCAWSYVSKDKSEAYLTLVVNRSKILSRYYVRLRGLSPEKRYKDLQSGRVYFGDTLMNAGLFVGRNLKDTESVVVHLKEI